MGSVYVIDPPVWGVFSLNYLSCIKSPVPYQKISRVLMIVMVFLIFVLVVFFPTEWCLMFFVVSFFDLVADILCFVYSCTVDALSM